MAGFACAACGAEFETQERLDEHMEKEHSVVQEDAGSTHTAPDARDQDTQRTGQKQ
ncbi:MAG: hypothetical protein M3P24_07710 [Gemmatimonadota bacterium]|nr:hypothetical protein [Gemmatimonadota bacterium]